MLLVSFNFLHLDEKQISYWESERSSKLWDDTIKRGRIENIGFVRIDDVLELSILLILVWKTIYEWTKEMNK